MKSFTKFSLRFAVYLLIIAYLVGDLYIFNGPLNRQILAKDPNSAEAVARAKANGVVARVFNHKITRRQLNFAIQERLWLEGKQLSDLNSDSRKLVTYAALGDLIDHELIRVKSKVNTMKLKVSDAEIHERVRRFASRFETKGHLRSAMKAMGIPDEHSLQSRIAARIQQEKYVAMRVDPLTEISKEEIAAFYETHSGDLTLPERIQASHIFIATLETPTDEAKQVLEQALTDLTANRKDFATLARDLSVDYSSKNNSGDLGWMSRSRLPLDFASQIFLLPLNTPTIIQTKLGWHLVTVTNRKDARSRSLEECREEIKAALASAKRHQAVNDFRSALRRFETEKIDIFHDQLIE